MPIQALFRRTGRILLISLILLLQAGNLLAQKKASDDSLIRLSSIWLSKSISDQTSIFIDSAGEVKTESFRGLPSLHPIPVSLSRKIPARYVNMPSFLQFSLLNDTDSAQSVFFLPGFYFKDIDLYKYDSTIGEFEPVSGQPGNKDYNRTSVGRIYLKSGESATFICELQFIKTTVNTITPILCNEFFLPNLLEGLRNERRLNSIITYLTCGVMLMMIFYSLAAYFTNWNIEFLYYLAYAALLGFMFFFKAYLYKYPAEANFFFESYFDFILQCAGTLFYFLFLRQFTNAKTEFPALEKMLLAQQVITISGMIAFTILNFFADNFPLQNMVENLIKYSWSACTIFVIVYAIYTGEMILRYLAIGHSFLFLGGLVSLFLINSSYRFNPTLSSLINDSLFWYEMGILFELVFFLIALSFKTRLDIAARAREKERILLEYEKSAIEKQMAVLAAKQEERNRISADMHDELGSGVTAIRLMSELVKTKMKDNTLPEIEKISHSANDLIGKMNTIIWTMKSTNDTVDNMIAYVRSYAAEFFDNTEIVCRVESPDNLPAIDLSGEKRRNSFLCIKEALNNVVKHSHATEVVISFRIGPHLVIQIHDNGIGLNYDNIREFSNGLTNMHKRMESIDGHFSIRHHNGTIVTLSVPLQ